MTQTDAPVSIQWEVDNINRGPVVRTMKTELAGVRYRVSVETTGRRNASKRRLADDQNSTSIGDWHATNEAAVNACIKDMGFERHEVAVKFVDAAVPQPAGNKA